MARTNVRQTTPTQQVQCTVRQPTINIQVVSPDARSAADETAALLGRLGVIWMVFNAGKVVAEYEQLVRRIDGLKVIRH